MNYYKTSQDTLRECKKYGIETDIDKRWENGIEHHSRTFEIYNMLERSDRLFGGDYFGWKSGGDGDNGETLMCSLSILLELEDAKKNDANKD